MSSRRKPTLADIARETATSVATVSRAMSQPGLVQPETLERVRQVAARLGYVPNRRARALVSGRSNTIGVVVPTLNSPIFSATLQEMQRAFSANGYQLLIASHEYDSTNEASALAQLISHGVDGLVVVGGDRPQSTRTMIDAAGIPLVQMWEGREGFDRVLVDSFHAGALITRYLLDLGHTRFGVISGHLRTNDRQAARVNGIRSTLQENGIALAQTQISQHPLTLSDGRAGCMNLLGMVPRPSAIIGTADLLAIGAMIEAQGRGIDVPDSISFAGIDNVGFAAHLSPPLTTVDVPAASIGAETAVLMLQRLNDGDLTPDRSVQLPVNLVVRHSTGPCTSG